MRSILAASSVGLLLLGLAACADQDSEPGTGCVMQSIADMQVLNDRGSPVVKVAINGTPVAFLVDTGAAFSLIDEDAAIELGLTADRDSYAPIRGVGGTVYAHEVKVHELSLGSAGIRNTEFLSVSDGVRKRKVAGLPVVGLFGGDFLANYNVGFDLPNHTVSLYVEHHCSGNIRPWQTGDFYRLPFSLDHDTAVDLDIKVNNVTTQIQLDSGSSTTVLGVSEARAAGVDQAAMQHDRTGLISGIDSNQVPAHIHQFDSLDIGPEHFSPASLAVGDIVSNSLLGATFFRNHRIWISYPHEALYVQKVVPVPTPQH